jgi:HEAT repeat protein
VPEHHPNPEPAARRRRRAALAGFEPGADPLALVDDPDPAVRAAALGAAARRGVLEPARLASALADADPEVRRRAGALAGAALAGEHWPAAVLAGALVTALDDDDPLVAEMAAWALGEASAAGDDTVVDALCSAAGSRRDPLVREAAVAALGSIGAARTVDTVLDALGGPPALRRRAALSLAAFDDPRAEAALGRCLEDRDWQVREVAETLLELPPGAGPGPRPGRDVPGD